MNLAFDLGDKQTLDDMPLVRKFDNLSIRSRAIIYLLTKYTATFSGFCK